MAAYKIFFRKSVWKDFKSIPNKDLKRILKRIETLGENPRFTGCKKLTGQEKYRLRQGRYRILYSIQDEELSVWIIRVGSGLCDHPLPTERCVPARYTALRSTAIP